MATVNVNLTCDLQHPVQVQYIGGNMFSQDNAGNTINVDVFDDGEPATLGGSISANVIRADGATVAVSGALSGNRAYVIFPQACYAVPGTITVIIKNTESSTVTTIAAFVANVYQSTTDTVVDPGQIIPSISALIAQIEAAVDSIPVDYSGLLATIAADYSSSKTYPIVGMYAWQGGVLKRNIVPITTAETYTAAHWTNAVIGDDLSALKSAIDGNLPDGIQAATGVRVYPFQSGYESTPAEGTVSSHTDSANYKSVKIPVTSTDVVYFSGEGGLGSQRLFAILDEDSKLIYRTTTNNSGVKTVKISNYTGAAYIIINSKASYTGKVYCYIGMNTVETDAEPVQNSTNPVQSGGVFSEIKIIKDLIGEQTTNVTGSADVDYYWNSESTTAVKTAYSGYKAYNAISVTPGDKMRLTCTYSGASSKQWPFLFVDDDLAIIGHEGTRNTSNIDLTVNVPVGATKLLMTCGKNEFCGAYVVELKPIPDNSFSGTFDFKGKNVAIIGDSISTNGDYSETNPLGNVPEIIVKDADIGVELSAYVTYYDIGTTIGGHTIVESEVGTELTFTPVDGDQGKIIGKPKNNNVATTNVWWEVAADVLGFNPIPVCWSGSSITDHEEDVTDNGHYIYKCAHSFHPSQIRKCGIRTPGSMERTAPDMIIIYRGTNDLTHSPYARLTDDLDSFPTTYPDADTFDDGGTTRYSFVKGMRLLIKKLHEAYPETKIVLCTLNYFRRLSHTAIYTSNGYNNWLEYNAMIRRIADYEGCDLIEFDKDGLNYWNAANGYYNEGTSETAYWTHPNTKGQARLGSRALVDLRKVNDMTVPT